MPDGRVNNGGPRPNSGRPSARDERIKNLVIQKSWEKLANILDKLESKDDIQKFCLQIGLKDMVVKQDHTTDGKEMPAPIIKLNDYVQRNDSNSEDTEPKQED